MDPSVAADPIRESEMDETVSRLQRCLVEELRRRGHPQDQPLKVSEVYKDVVPYRLVRSKLGVELNADYEHALLRLLGGEGGVLRLESEEARQELEQEADAPYPFTGLFRKFAGSEVRVRYPAPDQDDDAAATASEECDSGDEAPPPEETIAQGEPGSAPRADEPDSRPRAAEPETESEVQPGTEEAAPGPAAAPVPVTADAEEVPTRPLARSENVVRAASPVRLHREEEDFGGVQDEVSVDQGVCAFCSDALPVGRRVRYCPFCGADQRLLPCPRCDTVLERGWRFCIRCGHDVDRG